MAQPPLEHEREDEAGRGDAPARDEERLEVGGADVGDLGEGPALGGVVRLAGGLPGYEHREEGPWVAVR